MNKRPKTPAESKTVWVNVLALLGVVLSDSAGWLDKADPTTITIGAGLWALVNIVLRAITKSPLIFKPKED